MENKKFNGAKRAQALASPVCAFCQRWRGTESICETSALSSPNSAIRGNVVRALALFGPQAASAVPLLQGLTNDPAVRDGALEALRRIGSSLFPVDRTGAQKL